MEEGDANAFREFADTYSQYLFQVAYSVLHSVKDAEDVTQETMMKIYSSLPQYRGQGFKTWITRIAVNKAIDYKRSRDRKREELTEEWGQHMPAAHSGTVNSVEEIVLERQERERIRRKIRELPDSYRDVVVAFYIEEKSYQQIAEEQNLALKTVESKLYRAKKYMKKHWKGEERE